ncbi:DUF676-domain-containing protein [Gloeophyllum trabeum ATCC 11539]|uniref:DUF676-domain-containing protein n=1 Tax=Gloeophyllum trabeum (strain ATCC 11539 / FP-39264 / Madison 617) TaxID=670483 RepID=S7QB09_GLOTA|nr:DUF676-domain-containing protein [Gloeophyllum trabeum ATCC 11539]EPQ56502.1 DUF676-domain-containing protein [Gloeophyllum trabeum ATCC 11539]
MWGNPSHLAEMNRIICETHKRKDVEESSNAELEVLLPETNRDDSTYDGIDWGGERVAEEIYAKVEKIENDGKKVSRLSVTGYSLGGLVARYVIGILFQRGFFNEVTPVNFNTVATPHIGLLRYSSFFSSVTHALGPKLLSRTGEQFYGVDKWSVRGRPLLDVMADPNRIFYQALAKFQHIRIYANAVNDLTVPYITAAIEPEDPFVEHETNGIKIELDEKYDPIIKSYFLPSEPPVIPKPSVLSREWFAGLKPRPFLPPPLQFAFPFNILMYLALPFLVPVIITLVLIRFTSASKSSRARIQLLERDESYRNRLVHLISDVEKDVEGAVGEFMVDAGLTSDSSRSGEQNLEDESLQAMQKPSSHYPILSPAQRTRIAALNSLPGLRKERAFIHPTRNSHATIIVRDPKRFPFHKRGEGVIRHWADHFIL